MQTVKSTDKIIINSMSEQQNSGQEAFKSWYISGLQALLSANEIGEGTTNKLKKYITSENVRSAIEEGTKATAEQAEILKNLLQEAGGEQNSIPNEIMMGIDKASDQIAQSEDKDVRDAGVITSAQIALHYYMAAYGGLASTAKHLGLNEQAETLSGLVDVVKQADEKYTRMAEESINEKASA